MASSMIGAIRVALGLDTAQFEAGANKAASVARSKSKEMESSFAGAKRAIEGLLAAFAVGAITEQIHKSLEYAGSLAEVAKTLGVTTKDLQTFRYAATQTGVAQDQLEVGLRRLTVSIGKAELGSKAQQKAFGALGITLEQLKGKTTGDVFRMMSDSLSKVTDRSQRAAVEMTLMGRTGSTLDNMLAPGSARLNELAAAAQKLGIVLSDSQIQGAEETAHKLEAVKMVLSAQIAGVVADNAQSIYTLASALGTLTGQIVKFLGSNPTLALGIIGALAGKSLGGPIGMAVGAVAGATYGSQIDVPFEPGAKPDIAFLTHNLASENKRLKEMDKLGGNVDAASKGAQVKKVQALTDRLNAALGKTPPAPTGGDLPDFLAGDKKPKHAKHIRDKNEDDEFQFAQEQRQLDLQIIEAKKALSHDVSEQAALALDAIDLQQQMKNAEIDHKVQQAKRDLAEKKITQSTYNQIVSEAAIEKGKEAELTVLQKKAVLDQRDQQLLQQSIELDQQGYDIMKGQLQRQADMAQTMEERRKLELQLLDLTYKERAALDRRIIAENKDPVAVLKAQADLAAIPNDYALDRQGLMQQTRGPLEDYIAKLPDTVAKFNEAVQNLEVQGIDGLLDDITQLQGGFKSLLKTLLNTALQFAQGFAKLELQRGLSPLLQSLMGAGQGFLKTGAGNNMFGDLNKYSLGVDTGSALTFGGPDLGSLAAGLPGFAGGGSFMFRGMPGVDRNVLSMNGLPIARVSYGERAVIMNDSSSADQPGMYRPPVNMTVVTPNADSFNRSNRQVVRQMQRGLR